MAERLAKEERVRSRVEERKNVVVAGVSFAPLRPFRCPVKICAEREHHGRILNHRLVEMERREPRFVRRIPCGDHTIQLQVAHRLGPLGFLQEFIQQI